MKLYFSPGACSLATHIVLRESKLPFSLVKVDTATHQTAHGADFYSINPKGYVPVLEMADGERLSEGSTIAQYVGDRAEQRELMPAPGSMARYRVMEWQNYITSELHKSFTPLFNPALDLPAKAIFSGALRKKFAWVSEHLKDRQFLTGEQFTAADAYLFTVARWAKNVALDLSAFAPLQAYLARVAARPAVQEAMKAEGLLA